MKRKRGVERSVNDEKKEKEEEEDVPKAKRQKGMKGKRADTFNRVYCKVTKAVGDVINSKGLFDLRKLRNKFRNFGSRTVFTFCAPLDSIVTTTWTGSSSMNDVTFCYSIAYNYLAPGDNFKIILGVFCGGDDKVCVKKSELKEDDISDKYMYDLFLEVAKVRVCSHINHKSVRKGENDSFIKRGETVVKGDEFYHPDVEGKTDHRVICIDDSETDDETFKAYNCPGHSKRKRSDECNVLFKSMSHISENTKKKYKKRINENQQKNEKIKKLEQIIQQQQELLNDHYFNPLTQEIIKCLENGRLKSDNHAYTFFHEQFKIRNLSSKGSLKWLEYPVVFSFFQEVREYTGVKGYRCLIGEGNWKEGHFSGILAGPSIAAIDRINTNFQYPPGLCESPMVTIIEALKFLRLQCACATIVGDEMHLNSGYSRMTINSTPLWAGRTCFDPLDSFADIRNQLNLKLQSLIQDEEKKKRCQLLIQNIDKLLLREKMGEVATKINQIYLNISGKFLGTDGKSYFKCYKFPLYWFCQRSLSADETAGLIISSVIYTQQLFEKNEFTRGKIVVDSICWDGESGVQGFVNRCGKKDEINKVTYEVYIPLLDRFVIFSNDIGHLLKAIRNDLYNIHDKKKSPRKFPVQVNETWELFPIPLFKVLKKLIEIESLDNVDKISRLRKEHAKLTTRTKMCQSLVSDIFKREVVLAIFGSLLPSLLGRPVGFDDENEEAEGEMDDEEQNNEPSEILERMKLLSVDFYKHFKLTEEEQQNLPQQEQKLGITLKEIVGVVSFINFMSNLKHVFKSSFPIHRTDDWRLVKLEKLRLIWKQWHEMTYKPEIEEEVVIRMNFNEFPAENEEVPQVEQGYSRDDIINVRNVNKLKSNFLAFPTLMTSRLQRGVSSSPVDSQSQDVCETHFSLARLVAGLNNSPTIVEYQQRMGHVIIRNHRKIKRSSYEFVDFQNENQVIHSLFSKDLLDKLKEQRRKLNQKFLDHYLNLFPNFKIEPCERKERVKKNVMKKVGNILGYSIYASKRLHSRNDSIINFLNGRFVGEVAQNKTTVPQSWISSLFYDINVFLRHNLSYQNCVLYPEILEEKLFRSCHSKFLSEFLESLKYNLNKDFEQSASDYGEKLFKELLRTFIKIKTIIRFEKFELLPGKLQQSFRGKVDSL